MPAHINMQTKPKQKSSTSATRPTGYAKSEETRQKILTAALDLFGDRGFSDVGTREIAKKVGVNQPAINYHFVSKEGLYLACADKIISEYQEFGAHYLIDVQQLLQTNPTPQQAREALTKIIVELAHFFLKPNSLSHAFFSVHEMHHPSSAYDRLYNNIWLPGVELVSSLIEAIYGEDAVKDVARMEALMLISSLVTLTTGRQVTLQSMDWAEIGEPQIEFISRLLTAQIARIG